MNGMDNGAYLPADTPERGRLLSELLTGGAVERPDIAGRLFANGIDLDFPFFCTALIPDTERLPAEGDCLRRIEALANSVRHPMRAYAADFRGMFVLILCASTDEQDGVNLFEDTARYLVGLLNSEFGANMSVYLGCVVYSPRDIPASLHSAMLLYNSAPGNDRTDGTVSISKPTLSGQNSMIYLSELHLMLGYLINSEFRSAAQILERVFGSYIREHKLYNTVMSERLNFFVSTFHQAVEAAVAGDPQAMSEYLKLKSQLEVDSYPQQEHIHTIYRRIAELAEDSAVRRRSAAIGPATETRDYIDRHYDDPMLDITMITEKLGYSTSYLTRLFKSAYGMTILNYITSKRISASENLLRGSNLTAEEIAEKVGYGSVSAFTRAFQKLNGISPNQYRKSAAGA